MILSHVVMLGFPSRRRCWQPDVSIHFLFKFLVCRGWFGFCSLTFETCIVKICRGKKKTNLHSQAASPVVPHTHAERQERTLSNKQINKGRLSCRDVSSKTTTLGTLNGMVAAPTKSSLSVDIHFLSTWQEVKCDPNELPKIIDPLT